jgi:hypothetical protein
MSINYFYENESEMPSYFFLPMLLIHGRWMNCKNDTDGINIKENENSAKCGEISNFIRDPKCGGEPWI